MLEFGFQSEAMQWPALPVCDMCQEVFFKKPAPFFQNVEEAHFKDLDVNPKPSIEHSEVFELANFSMQIFIIINLLNKDCS